MESAMHQLVTEYRLLLARGGMAAAELLGRLVRLFRRDFQAGTGDDFFTGPGWAICFRHRRRIAGYGHRCQVW